MRQRLVSRRWRGGRRGLLRPSLLSMPLLDELLTGFPVLALPLLRDDLGLSYAQAGLLFTAGEISALVFEPTLNVLSDRASKRWPVLLGLLGLVAAFALAANASGFPQLLAAFVLLFPANGAAVGLAQATLIDEALHEAPRTMTRWTFLAGVGDLLSSPTVALLLALGFGWRGLFWLAAAIWLFAAAVLWPQRFPAPAPVAAEDDDGPPGGTLAGAREALRRPGLLRWVGVVLLATVLDEIFLGFAALYLSDALHFAGATVSLALGATLVGALVGLAVLERVVGRLAPERLLRPLALVALLGVAGLLAGRSLWIVAPALFLIGLGAAAWYPLGQAAAYASLPGRSGAVRALLIVLGAPLDIGLPVGIGAAAERWGIATAVGLLGLAPIAVLLLTLPRPPAGGRLRRRAMMGQGGTD